MKYERYTDKASPYVAAGMGFFVTGLNLKIISLTLSAGHLISASSNSFGIHMAELTIFFAICMLPLIMPAILETISHDLMYRIMTPCNRFLKRYGRFVTAAILIIFGGVYLKFAFAIMP